MILKSFEEIKTALTRCPEKKRVAVIMAQDEHALESVVSAAHEGLVHPVLIGDVDKIKIILDKLEQPYENMEILSADSAERAAMEGASMIRRGEADCIMKGRLETGALMKVLVHRELGIRTEKTMSMLTVTESPFYHKLFGITDPGLIVRPSLEQKRDEILSAVASFHNLGVETPKVAVLAAVEKVDPKMPETADAKMLKEMEIPGCIVEGPISFDLAMNPEAAALKGFDSPVAGDADIIVVPDIVSGNIAVKSLSNCGGARTCGVVLGGMAPIILTSRSSSAEEKYYSIILSAAVSGAGL